MKISPNNFQRRRRSRVAFTLLEIMIAISIFALVMVAIYSSWSSILKGSRIGMKAAAEVQRTRVAMRALEESLASAVMYVDNAKYYHFSTDTSGDNAYISFVARLPSSFPGSGLFQDQDMRRVTFYVEKGNLMLAQSTLLEATKKIGNPYTIPLAPNVALFDMEFYDGVANKWFAEWISTNQLPRMVRVALAFGDKNDLSRKPENMTIRSIYLGGVAITRQGAGVLGGSGQGLAPMLRQPRPNLLRQNDDDKFCGWDLPESFRGGVTFGAKERSSMFPE
jgi:general secretion pathway protein J